MKCSVRVDVVATTMGLVLALAVLSVPLASANTLVPGMASDAGTGYQPVSENKDSSDDLGEASYDIEDCEPASEGEPGDDGVESRDLDECQPKPE